MNRQRAALQAIIERIDRFADDDNDDDPYPLLTAISQIAKDAIAPKSKPPDKPQRELHR